MTLSKRILDIFFIFLFLPLFIPVLLVLVILKLIFDGRPILHISERVGKDNVNFNMYKFRTMKLNTPQVATHLLENPSQHYTFLGLLLRKTSLDELPQIINVFLGNMTLVGPRPALFNQDDLINLRTKKGVHKFTPGITGWAQVNGRDSISIPEKVKLDSYYCTRVNIYLDFKILVMTIISVFKKSDVSH